MEKVVTWSQFGEDIHLYNKVFGDKKNGVYIELGALDGNLYSNTKFFEHYLSWEGILIEPHPVKFRNLLLNRSRKNKFFNCLVSTGDKKLKFRLFDDIHAAVSGVEDTIPPYHFKKFFNAEENSHLKQDIIEMKPETLTDIVKLSGYEYIDLLSLDVEGHEEQVLQSYDFEVPIRVILIETLPYTPEQNNKCKEILRKRGYTYHSSVYWNEVWILQENDD